LIILKYVKKIQMVARPFSHGWELIPDRSPIERSSRALACVGPFITEGLLVRSGMFFGFGRLKIVFPLENGTYSPTRVGSWARHPDESRIRKEILDSGASPGMTKRKVALKSPVTFSRFQKPDPDTTEVDRSPSIRPDNPARKKPTIHSNEPCR
jgi:hypothetical protein